MKKLLFLLVICLLHSNVFGQNYNCNNLSILRLNNLYQNNKKLFAVYDKGNDVTEHILGNSSRLFPQACINSWAEWRENGENYLYNRFVSDYGQISKQYYLENIEYFEILRTFNREIRKKFPK